MVYAVLSLTVVRMIPVALSLFGTHLDRATVGITGWFGPRGLASVVFALLAYDSLDAADAQLVLGAVTMVVLFSVVAHGVSARPLTRWYTHRLLESSHDGPEHDPAPHLPTRSLTRPRRHGTLGI